MEPLDINKCRSIKYYSYKEYIMRILWTIFKPLFRLSPRNFFFGEYSFLELLEPQSVRT